MPPRRPSVAEGSPASRRRASGYGDPLSISPRDLHEGRHPQRLIPTGFGSLTDLSSPACSGLPFPPAASNRRSPRGVRSSACPVIADYHVHCHLTLCDRRGAFGGISRRAALPLARRDCSAQLGA